MHLLNVETLQLETFYGSDTPEYAVLSHTWGGEEVTYQDYVTDTARSKTGWIKILGSVKEAKSHGCQYIWIDTCCIDKTSSTELSEAINSMFSWYRKSKVCLAYLGDISEQDESDIVHTSTDPDSGFEIIDLIRDPVCISTSRWFKRGWTLQELIAPNHVYFYNTAWRSLGEKRDLGKDISSVTGIDLDVLYNHKSLYTKSVAQRMSWAAERETTRIEDIAYCLLGIFNVSMPLLYGEGEQAFIRLQEEIMRSEYDQSLFAWDYHFPNTLFGTNVAPGNVVLGTGVLAPHPAAFRDAANIGPHSRKMKPYVVTNRGIEFYMPISEVNGSRPEPSHFALLRCNYNDRQNTHIGIPLQRLSNLGLPYSRDEFCRVPHGKLQEFRYAETKHFTEQKVYLLKFALLSLTETPRSFHRCWVRDPGRQRGLKLHRACVCQYPVDDDYGTLNSLNRDTDTMTWRKLWGGARAALLFFQDDKTAFIIVLTFVHLSMKDDLVSINIHLEPVQYDVQNPKSVVEQVSLRQVLRKDIPLESDPGLNEGKSAYCLQNTVMTVRVKKEVMLDGDTFVLDLLFSDEQGRCLEEATVTS